MLNYFYNVPLLNLLTVTAYGEAGGESNEGVLAVLNVIKNRVKAYEQGFIEFVDKGTLEYTGDIWKAVVLKPYQFSMYNEDNPVRLKAENWVADFYSYLESDNRFKEVYDLVVKFLGGETGDNSNGAVYYHANYVQPSWSYVYTKVAEIGNHIFYTDNKILAFIREYPTETGISVFGIMLIGLIVWAFLSKEKEE